MPRSWSAQRWRRGIRRSARSYFENSDEAAAFLKGFVAPGDLLLLKGSRGVRMEKVLEAIDAEHRRQDEAPVSENVPPGGVAAGRERRD